MFKPFRLFRSWPSLARLFKGGRVNDVGRLPRYALIFVLASAGLWTPIVAYLRLTPPTYTSDVSLILPGSGAQASVNLAELGQASSSAASAFSSTRVSPTQTYKRLIAANRTLERAASQLKLERGALGSPRIKLVDETSLIHFSMRGPTPEEAQIRANAILAVFLEELDVLRKDELDHREQAARVAITDYEKAVDKLRKNIAQVQRESGLVSFDHYKDIVAERDDLASRVEEARSELRSADASMLALTRLLGIDANMAALNLRLLADPEVQELSQTLAEQNASLAEAQGRFGARHPVVTSAWHALAGTKEQLFARGQFIAGPEVVLTSAKLDLAPNPQRSALLADLVGMAAQCESKSNALETIEEQLAAVNDRIDGLAPLAARLDDLSRDYQVAEAVFASALARVDTSKAEVYASYPLVQVLADASLPDRAMSPRPKIAIAAGGVATLMVLFALALAWVRRPLISKLLQKADG